MPTFVTTKPTIAPGDTHDLSLIAYDALNFTDSLGDPAGFFPDSAPQVATLVAFTETPDANGYDTYKLRSSGIAATTVSYQITGYAQNVAVSGFNGDHPVTEVELHTVSNQGAAGPPTDYIVVGVDQHHVLLVLASNPTSSSTDLLFADDGSLATSTLVRAYTGTTPTLVQDNTLGGPFPCFAAGTLVRTADGECAVEAIAVGHLLATVNGVDRPVIWVGSRTVELNGDPAVQPIRIRAGAFATGVPSRDLLVSPDHAILVGDVLVQAKLLVNGGSILVDAGATSVTYIHIELDRHAAIFAEGLAAESYLDSGNRAQFTTDMGPVDFATPAALYAERGCAELALDAATVRPIWSRLAQRATAMGLTVSTVATSTDPDLRLVAGGREIRPSLVDGARHVFAVPAGVDAIRIVSRAAKPSDVQPWLEDRRRLGVAVSRLSVIATTAAVDVALDTVGEGWWSAEGQFRWTNGNAALELAPAEADRLLELTVQGTVAYPVRAAA